MTQSDKDVEANVFLNAGVVSADLRPNLFVLHLLLYFDTISALISTCKNFFI